MDISRVQRGERLALYGGILLVVGLFLHWYDVTNGSDLAKGTYTGWQMHHTLRWALLAAALAPIILAWIIANDRALSWPRGQMTMVVAIAAFGLVGYNGVIDQPTSSNSFVSLEYGWFISLLGTILMLVGSVMRQSETEIRRKPPGTI
jgi:archaellum biogenesis protein FlaJ (TadC family)